MGDWTNGNDIKKYVRELVLQCNDCRTVPCSIHLEKTLALASGGSSKRR